MRGNRSFRVGARAADSAHLAAANRASEVHLRVLSPFGSLLLSKAGKDGTEESRVGAVNLLFKRPSSILSQRSTCHRRLDVPSFVVNQTAYFTANERERWHNDNLSVRRCAWPRA